MAILRHIFGLLLRGYMRSPAGQRRLREAEERSRREYEVREEAAWFGATGLDEETERELPHYLRRELGQSLFDEESLKAADLKYVGVFEEEGLNCTLTVHYWRMPDQDGPCYAYIDDGGFGWGNRQPPRTN